MPVERDWNQQPSNCIRRLAIRAAKIGSEADFLLRTDGNSKRRPL